VSGIVGTGATVILLPVLVIVFGPREAVPIMAIVALMSNFAKITSWWKEIDWKACGAYALGGVPAAAVGARTLLILPENTVEVARKMRSLTPRTRRVPTHSMQPSCSSTCTCL